MRFKALATDYDGTLAHHGVVSESAVQALERLRKSGRYCLLVTGREMKDLYQLFPRLDLFHVVVAENGAILFNPQLARRNQGAACAAPASVCHGTLFTRRVSTVHRARVSGHF